MRHSGHTGLLTLSRTESACRSFLFVVLFSCSRTPRAITSMCIMSRFDDLVLASLHESTFALSKCSSVN